MRDEIVQRRRAERQKYVEENAKEDQRKVRARERRAAYIQRLKDEGKYEEFKRRKAAYEKRRVAQEPDFHKIKIRERNLKWRQQKYNWAYIMVRNARWRSADKGLPFSITEQDIVIPEVCPVLGITLTQTYGRQSESSPSLDRIRPELGYVPGNIRVISQRANRLKCDGTSAELKLVYEDLLRLGL